MKPKVSTDLQFSSDGTSEVGTLEEIKSLLQQLVERLGPDDELWPLKRVASCLGVSERTARRRIQSDPRFPAPIVSVTYNDRGKVRRTQPRWEPSEIIRYRKMRESESHYSA